MHTKKPSDHSDASVLKRIVAKQFQLYLALLSISDDELQEIYNETLKKLDQTDCHDDLFVKLMIRIGEAKDLFLETESVQDADLQQLRNELGSCLNRINKRIDKDRLGYLASLL